jgi:Uma2 family endonuclease
VAVRLDPKHAPQPDILVVRRDTYDGDATSYPPDVVIIAVEIMSSDQRKDRVVRPDEYAIAGIPHYWRIERTPEKRLIAYTYELDPVNLKYVETAVHHGRLTTDQPWPLDCDLHGLATP